MFGDCLGLLDREFVFAMETPVVFAASLRDALLGPDFSARRAQLRNRQVPRGKLALRVAHATVKRPAAPRATLREIPHLTGRTLDAQRQGARVPRP